MMGKTGCRKRTSVACCVLRLILATLVRQASSRKLAARSWQAVGKKHNAETQNTKNKNIISGRLGVVLNMFGHHLRSIWERFGVVLAPK